MKLPNEVVLSESLPQCKISFSFEADPEKLPTITSAVSAHQYLLSVWDLDSINYKEEFYVLLLNNSKKCMGWSKISSGGRTATIVEPAMVFQVAMLANASSIIVAHNHPSGVLSASIADISVTKKLLDIGNLLNIILEDHIIVGQSEYLSFLEEGMIK